MSRIPKPVRDALRDRSRIDGYPCCEVCGKPGANNAHHRLNLSQGGSNDLSNLMLLDGSGTTGCHGYITEHPDWAHALGYTVWRGESPLSRPVLRRNTFVLLDDLGGFRAVEGAA